MPQRRLVVPIVAIAVVALLAWWIRATPPPPPEPPLPVATVPGGDPPSPTTQKLPGPSIELTKRVEVRPATPIAPGALEGTVVDAETEEGIAGAELTFSHDEGAYSTTSGPAGAFRFAPGTAGAYRLIAAEAKGYASFEGEFGRSPVSFTSVAGKDIAGVVLRLSPASKGERGRHVHRRSEEEADAGDRDAAVPRGSLRGRVFDARSGTPVAAFAVALWRREGIAVSTMLAAASFIDPSGAYEISGLAPGTYEAAAMAAGYAWSSYAVVQVADSPAQADFRLEPGARIPGIVTDDATKQPIAGVALSLEGRRGDTPDLPVAPLSPEAESGPDGRFALEHVPPDAISLRARKTGYLVRLVSLGRIPEDGDTPPLAIALTPRDAGDGARFELTGIGAVLRARGAVLEIQQIVPGAGAADAGLAPGDEIVSIDGVPIAGFGFEGAIAAIRGPEGTAVALRIRRAGRETDVLVTRKLVRQ
jgi:membrane-associated protease RseP (regulator of RpoE activity)